jgi:hypothetical protein
MLTSTRRRVAATSSPRRAAVLARFRTPGLKTGSRATVMWRLTWDQIDPDAGVMYRRAPWRGRG